MNAPEDTYVNAAKKLLSDAHVTCDDAPAAASACRVYHTLSRALSPVIGEVGFRALFVRSVKLLQRRSPQALTLLKLPRPKESSDEFARCLVACLAKLEPASAERASIFLFATMFGLVAKLIGEPLVWQLVKSAREDLADTDHCCRKDLTK